MLGEMEIVSAGTGEFSRELRWVERGTNMLTACFQPSLSG